MGEQERLLLKYTIAGLVIVAALGGLTMFGISQFNDSGAEAGPAPTVTLTLGGGATPATLELTRDQIVELRIENAGATLLVARVDSGDVDQLPVSMQSGKGWTGAARTGFELMIPEGQSNAALFRARKSGEYQLVAETPGSSAAPIVVTLAVH